MSNVWNGAAIKGLRKRLLCIIGMCWKRQEKIAGEHYPYMQLE